MWGLVLKIGCEIGVCLAMCRLEVLRAPDSHEERRPCCMLPSITSTSKAIPRWLLVAYKHHETSRRYARKIQNHQLTFDGCVSKPCNAAKDKMQTCRHSRRQANNESETYACASGIVGVLLRDSRELGSWNSRG